MSRVIGHLDLDYFYAQVEEAQDKSLRDRPVLVCVFSGRTKDSGVVSTANYVARGLGIKSGMPISLARKRLAGKEGSFIPMQRDKYEKISERIMQTARRSVDLLEQSGIDEAFFDITQRSAGDFVKAGSIAREVKESIISSEGLTCSVGIATNKAIAKIASDFAKPDGLTVVPPEKTGRFLEPLPVEKLYGVGPKTKQALATIGVETIGQLARQKPESLEKIFGLKLGAYLHRAANGVSDEPVIESQRITQLSRIVTLKENTKDPEKIYTQLSSAIDDLHSKLVAKNRSFRTLSAIAILTDLSTRTKSRTLEAHTNDIDTLRSQAKELFAELAASSGKELRRAGIRVAELSEIANQTSLREYLG